MINLLIADSNIYYAKSLVNYIVNKNSEIRLLNISTDGKEALYNIISKPVDVVLLDLKMPSLSGIDILNILNKNQANKKINIIVISEEIELISKIKCNTLVEYFINKSQGMKYILKKIEDVIEKSNLEDSSNKIRDKALNELLYLGYNIKHKGTIYLLDTICIICQSENTSLIYNLEKYLYSEIASKYQKNIKNIKSNIMKATDCMYMECDKNRLKEYFSFAYDYKPTPKVIIGTIISKIMNSIK